MPRALLTEPAGSGHRRDPEGGSSAAPLRAGRHGNGGGGRSAPGAFVGSDTKMAGGRGAGPGAALGSARSLQRGAVAEAGAGLPALEGGGHGTGGGVVSVGGNRAEPGRAAGP